MIRDESVANGIRKSWDTVRMAEARVKTNAAAGMFGGGVPLTMDFVDFSHSLVLLFAFSVLEDVLHQSRDEGRFESGNSKLGTLMFASKDALSWIDFDAVFDHQLSGPYSVGALLEAMTDLANRLQSLRRTARRARA